MKEIKIIFLPDGKAAVVEAGTTLRAAAGEAGIHVSSVCGGDGTCGKCRVIVRQGEVQTEPTGFLSPEEVAQGYVLACRTQVFGDLLVEVPLESRWEGRALLGQLDSIRFGQILPCHPGARPYRDEPLSQKVFLSLPEPTLADHVSDWERVQRALGKEGKEGEGRGGKGIGFLIPSASFFFPPSASFPFPPLPSASLRFGPEEQETPRRPGRGRAGKEKA
jgi:ferredoxin